jgi:hypothetical protein
MSLEQMLIELPVEPRVRALSSSAKRGTGTFKCFSRIPFGLVGSHFPSLHQKERKQTAEHNMDHNSRRNRQASSKHNCSQNDDERQELYDEVSGQHSD